MRRPAINRPTPVATAAELALWQAFADAAQWTASHPGNHKKLASARSRVRSLRMPKGQFYRGSPCARLVQVADAWLSMPEARRPVDGLHALAAAAVAVKAVLDALTGGTGDEPPAAPPGTNPATPFRRDIDG